jgi:hypothetical protein
MDVKITRLTTTGSDQTINLGTTNLVGIYMEGAADLVVKDGSTTKASLTAFNSSIDFKGATFVESLIVSISANSAIILWV